MDTDKLEQFILDTLKDCGFPEITEEQKKVYVPRLLSHLEQRIGIEMLPKLSDQHVDSFSTLIDNPETSIGDWQKFWYESIPNFAEELQRILDSFSKDVKEVMIV